MTWARADENTRKREISGLLEACAVTGCSNLLIVTADEEEEIILEYGLRISVLPAWKWLLGK